jgi:hypothetical protein
MRSSSDNGTTLSLHANVEGELVEVTADAWFAEHRERRHIVSDRRE